MTLDVRDCTFLSNIDFDWARFEHSVYFVDNIAQGKVSAYSATFNSTARFEDSQFLGETSFRRAVFNGALFFEGATFYHSADFYATSCFSGSIFNDASFHGPAEFSKFQAAELTSFSDAEFRDNCDFDDIKFGDVAVFEESKFGGVTSFYKTNFTSNVRFVNTEFSGPTSFLNAHFHATAHFGHASFKSNAAFVGSKFEEEALFSEVAFVGDTRFSECDFVHDAWFRQAVFVGTTSFLETVFNRGAYFNGALFSKVNFRDTSFNGTTAGQEAWANVWNFYGAVFNTAEFGPWVGGQILMTHAVLNRRARALLVAQKFVIARHVQIREGAHLLIHSPRLNLMGAEFVRHTILSPPGAADMPGPIAERPAEASKGGDTLLARIDPQVDSFRTEVTNARTQLMASLHSGPRCDIESLSRISGGELSILGAGLDNCTFAGATAVDKMRIGDSCSFRYTGKSIKRKLTPIGDPYPIPLARRRIIVEEILWRDTHTNWESPDYVAVSDRLGVNHSVPSARTVAGIYRELRKGLEDSKNHPEAADFYYGEMEMRRMARRESTDQSRLTNSRAECVLLWAYWAIAGYGLRASRAIIALVIVIFAAGLLFTLPAFATLNKSNPQIQSINPSDGRVIYRCPDTSKGLNASQTGGAVPAAAINVGTLNPSSNALASETYVECPQPTEAPPLSTALLYSARESVSLSQAFNNSLFTLTGLGMLVVFGLRISGPILIALAILAFRNRTKR